MYLTTNKKMDITKKRRYLAMIKSVILGLKMMHNKKLLKKETHAFRILKKDKS